MPKTNPAKPGNSTADSLINEFAQNTELKNPANGMDHDFEEPETPVEDFEQQPEPINQPQTSTEPINTPGDLLRPESKLSLETQATLLVGTFDSIQQMILRALHTWKLNKKLGGKEENQRIRELIEEIESSTKQISDLDLPERAKVRIVERTGKKIADLPFTDNEYDQLEEALRLILQDMPGYQLSPGAGLTLAAISIMAPRIVDIIID